MSSICDFNSEGDYSMSGSHQSADDGDDDSLCSYEYETEYEDDDTASELEGKSHVPENFTESLARTTKRSKSETEESFDLRRQNNIACDLQQAEKLMHRMVDETSSLLYIPPGAAHILLRYFKWDQLSLNDKYFGGEECVWRECGVGCRCAAQAAASSALTLQTKFSDSKRCGICFEDDLSSDQMFSMNCGHDYCLLCWKTYLESAINTDGPRCLYTSCPDPQCGEIITEDEVTKLAPTTVQKFMGYQLRSFIETNKNMRWCPGPSCEQIAVAFSEGFEGEMTCKCGTAFCLACGEAKHTPLCCQKLTQWTKKCMDESENANWILVYTKECPKCQVRIEKNQGCNHMTCRHCNYEFCWLCMGDWKKHSTCNKFNLKLVEKGQSEISRAQAELERYLHCYNRFHSHSVGQAFSEDQLRAFIKSKKNEEEAACAEMPEDRVFKNALRQLIECRRVLKYSYAVSYFMTNASNSKDLFEDQQKLLESFTERLSELTESKDRQEKEMMNMTGAVSHFVKNVLSGGPY